MEKRKPDIPPYARIHLEFLGSPAKVASFIDETEGTKRRLQAKKALEKMKKDELVVFYGQLLRDAHRTDNLWTPERRTANLRMIEILPFIKFEEGKLAETYLSTLKKVQETTEITVINGLLDAGAMITPHITPKERETIHHQWEEKKPKLKESWKSIKDKVKILKYADPKKYAPIQGKHNSKGIKDELNAQIAKLWSEGNNPAIIAEKLGRTRPTIMRHLEELTKKNATLPEVKKQKSHDGYENRLQSTLQLLQEGVSKKDIANHLGVTINAVYGYEYTLIEQGKLTPPDTGSDAVTVFSAEKHKKRKEAS